MKVYERWGGIALLAGVLCYFFAFILLVMAPAWVTDAEEPFVTDVNTGERVAVAPYTPEQAAGREIYIDQVCWHCHSQFVRPVNDEDIRWGPVSQAGEAMVDIPHLYGTRRIGPDLAREGGRRPDDWHYAHFYDPRYTVPQSVMPGFPWLFREHADADEIRGLLARMDTDGDGVVSPKLDRADLWDAADIKSMKDLDKSGVEFPTAKHGQTLESIQDFADTWSGKDEGDGLLSDYDARPRPTERARNLTNYVQRLGTAIGAWRLPIVLGTPMRGPVPPMWGVEDVPVGDAGDTTGIDDGQMPMRNRGARLFGVARQKASAEELEEAQYYSDEYTALMAAWRERNPEWASRLDRGEELYQRYCTGCHGELGRGNVPAAQHMLVRPRDFALADYNYRSTQVGNRPLDGDLFRSIYCGLPGTAMPPWKDLPHEQIWFLVDYIKSLAEANGDTRGKPWNDESQRIMMPSMPPMIEGTEDELFERGQAVYAAMKCINCHGIHGRGDGPGWNATQAPSGGVMRPRDLQPRHAGDQAELRMRGGATPRDLYRTIFSGLTNTPMPSSQNDFDIKWKAADTLKALIASGAPEAKITEAREKARATFFMPLGKNFEDPDGPPQEYLSELRRTKISAVNGVFGDDWALIWYVYRLAYGPDARWPDTRSDDE